MKEKGIRFLHLADVHLDTVFRNREPQIRALLGKAGQEAFQAGVDLALRTQCHAFLISGDLFDNQTLSFATENFLLKQMHRLATGQVQVFYAPGNHDPVGSPSRVQKIAWPENVHVFTQHTPEVFPLYNQEGELLAKIVGAAHQSFRESINLAKNFPVVGPEQVPHLALLHTWVTGSKGALAHQRYAPCTLEDLLDKGYVYWALGHVHQRTILAKEPYVVYPGNLQGRHARETGAKGAYLVEIEPPGQVQLAFYPLAPFYWVNLVIDDLRQATNLARLEQLIVEKVQQKLEEAEETAEILLSLELKGPSPLVRELALAENLAHLRENLATILPVAYLQLKAPEIFPLLAVEKYRGEPHLLGELLQLLDQLAVEENKLEALAPERLAGCPSSAEKLAYLKTLLPGLAHEAVWRLVEGERL